MILISEVDSKSTASIFILNALAASDKGPLGLICLHDSYHDGEKRELFLATLLGNKTSSW